MIYALSECESPRRLESEGADLPGELLTCQRVRNAFSPPIKAGERSPLDDGAAAGLAVTAWHLNFKGHIPRLRVLQVVNHATMRLCPCKLGKQDEGGRRQN